MNVCDKCGQEVVRHGQWFWGLPTDPEGRTSLCPVDNRIHTVEEPEDD
jgi:hypothetical protein